MAKLYPPNIEGTIPAFCKDSEGTVKITVPFSMNRAVGVSDVAGFVLKIKTVNGNFLTTLKVTTPDSASTVGYYDITSNMMTYFVASESLFNIGQYYKLQLAYLDTTGEVGYYSTVGVTKFTSMPSVSIANLTAANTNAHSYQYTGVYRQYGDASEKLYSSRFIITNSDKIVVEDSGVIIHNTTQDDKRYEAHEVFTISKDLSTDKTYYITFSVTTTNGLELTSPRYRLLQRRSIPAEIHADLIATLNYENGYVKLKMDDNIDSIISGTFLISRASSKNNYVWEEFRRFDLLAVVPNTWSLVDYTVEQGVTYKYSLQQYNANRIYSDRLISNSCYVDFEDAFLFDGSKQLKIRFNPKVSSFKNDLLESKIETIGSKHPYILRNGNVSYKEFSISGLISYQMDEDGLFYSKSELGISENMTDITSENIMAERLFKLKVLDWLTDGKPKLFKSPVEGNYIVRLMNVSLSPTDTLSRMLHTFSATAYEVAKLDAESLEEYHLIDPKENLTEQTRWATIDLRQLYLDNYTTENKNSWVKLNTRLAYSVKFTDMVPGTIIKIDGEKIQIGATGAFILSYGTSSIKEFDMQVKDLELGGFCTYSYHSKAVSIFGTILNVEISDVPCMQIIGEDYLPTAEQASIIKKKEFSYPGKGNDLFDALTDVRTSILSVGSGRFIKRQVFDIYIDLFDPEDFDIDTHYNIYSDMDCETSFDKFDTLNLYQLRCRRKNYDYVIKNEGYYVDANSEDFAPHLDYIIDGNHPYRERKNADGSVSKVLNIIPITKDLFDIEIGDSIINIETSGKYELKDIGNYSKIIKPHLGIISELSYSQQISTFNVEEYDNTTKQRKSTYTTHLKKHINNRTGAKSIASPEYVITYDNNLASETSVAEYQSKIAEDRKELDKEYLNYLLALDAAIKKYKKENGIIS